MNAITKEKREDRFIFSRWLQPKEVSGWLSKSDIFFMPALSVRTPVVRMQALIRDLVTPGDLI